MEKRLKVLVDAEIMDDTMNFELKKGSGRITFFYQACGGGGGCGGGCGKVCRRERTTTTMKY